MNWENRLQHAAHTDVGMRRTKNQDRHAVRLANDLEDWRARGHFFMVADGMGAHAAGELASKLAVEGVQHLYLKYSDLSPPDALKKAFLETNAEIHRRGQANTDFHNMGTTASALLLLPQGALVAHIGDSRVYRLRSERLEQLTRDHSLVWELREQLSDKSELAIPKNVITRSLGPNASVQVDIEGPLPVAQGDTFLLCSDGLTGRVTDEELAGVLGSLPPAEAVHLLTDLANLRGGPDNITVIVAQVLDEELSSVDHQPLKVGENRRPAGVQPAIWVCLGVCLLGSLLLAIAGSFVPALVAFLGAIAALLVALIARQRSRSSGVALSGGRRLGKGPYTETVRSSPEASLRLLREITQELRSVKDEGHTIEWSDFDTGWQSAQEAEKAGDVTAAMLCYSRAIRCVMRTVQERLNRWDGDSSID